MVSPSSVFLHIARSILSALVLMSVMLGCCKADTHLLHPFYGVTDPVGGSMSNFFFLQFLKDCSEMLCVCLCFGAHKRATVVLPLRQLDELSVTNNSFILRFSLDARCWESYQENKKLLC